MSSITKNQKAKQKIRHDYFVNALDQLIEMCSYFEKQDTEEKIKSNITQGIGKAFLTESYAVGEALKVNKKLENDNPFFIGAEVFDTQKHCGKAVDKMLYLIDHGNSEDPTDGFTDGSKKGTKQQQKTAAHLFSIFVIKLISDNIQKQQIKKGIHERSTLGYAVGEFFKFIKKNVDDNCRINNVEHLGTEFSNSIKAKSQKTPK